MASKNSKTSKKPKEEVEPRPQKIDVPGPEYDDIVFIEKIKKKLIKPLSKLTKNKIAITIIMMLFVAGLSIGIQYALVYPAIWIFGREQVASPVGMAIFTAVNYSLTLVLVVFLPKLIYKKWKASRDQLGLNNLPTWTDIGLAPIGYIVSLILAYILSAVFSFFPWFNAGEAQEVGYSYYIEGGDKIAAFVSLVIIAPIAEEIIFRGWLYGKIRARYAMPISILLVSVLFGIVHLQWNVGLNVFATSVVLCLLREITGTVYSGIILHMLKNGIAFVLLYVFNIGI